MSQKLINNNKSLPLSQSKSLTIDDDFLKKEDIYIDDKIAEIDQCFSLMKNKCI
jgi:hypothetical protein